MSKKQDSEPVEVQLFADGACSGNPGPGGWAFILRHLASGKEKEAFGGEPETTNNRMEMTAVIRGLEVLKRPTSVELVSDSVYVGKGLTEWMPKWKANGWRRREGGRLNSIKNEDLWRRLDELVGRHRVSIHPRSRARRPRRKRTLRYAGRGGVSKISSVDANSWGLSQFSCQQRWDCPLGGILGTVPIFVSAKMGLSP